MKPSWYQGWLLALCVLLVPVASQAQSDQGPISNFPLQNPSPTGAARNQSDNSTPLSNSELRMVPEDFAKLKLAPGFMIRLNVLDDSDYSGVFRIDEQGNLTLPVLGTLHVAGETASEARDAIKSQLLDRQILKDPQVVLTVVEYTAPEVTIIGEVTAPGKYPLLGPRNLVSVLALAGGPTNLAGNEVQITPGDGDLKPMLVHYSKLSDPKKFEDIIVHPGDTVQVRRAGIVYILGAVNRPGGYVMQESGTLNVLQAISLAMGTSMTASTGKIYLLRRNADGTEVDMALAYKKISEGKSADVQLHATDVLFVPSSKVKTALSNTHDIFSAAGSAAIYRY